MRVHLLIIARTICVIRIPQVIRSSSNPGNAKRQFAQINRERNLMCDTLIAYCENPRAI